MSKFDLYVSSSIYFCTVGLIYVEVRFKMYAVRFIFVRIDLFFCCFDIK